MKQTRLQIIKQLRDVHKTDASKQNLQETKMLDIPCVIFAGGKSSRMGEDKALLPFASFKTLTEYQLSYLNKIFSNVYISCKDKNKFDFEAHFIEEESKVFAPTAGFIAVFETLQVDKFFAISVDAPFITLEIIQTLMDADSPKNDATIASTEKGVEPLCGIYHSSLKEKFLKMLEENNHKLGLLLKNSQTNYVHFKDEKAFLNCNNPQEYQTALAIMKNR